MHIRTVVAVGVAALLLLIGVVCNHFDVSYAKLIALPVFMISFLARLALGMVGVDMGGVFAKIVGHLLGTFLSLWFYASALRRLMRTFGLFKTEEERLEDEAQGGFVGKLVGYAVGIGFVVLIMKFQGQQSDDFVAESKTAAEQQCSGNAACLANLEAHFDECFDNNHDSRRSGKYNRKHSLDQEGFDQCLAGYQTAAEEPVTVAEGVPEPDAAAASGELEAEAASQP